ncbi:MAG TPA: SDR family NAD(P)-dependent oxidoreductase [Usitatibacter sp.]|jgi:NAD(P)-dependent dehydrogenase (short-subunit alcohol dehydrogenase family)|nr:SDR family NAD(P)-dependent oxidoreductase [Usitatibacter sp.]
MQIQNHVFLVTGGGSGLGAASATMLAANGGKVVIADVNEAAGKDTSGFLGGTVRFVKTDVTDEASMQAAVDSCISAFGAIHGLVNCAGVAPGERVVGRNGPHALASFERAVKINLVGTFNAIRLAAAKMSVQEALPSGERGVIVNTSSVASMDGQIGQAAYAASKAGVNGMTLPVARELAKFGIRVMTIAPGIFDTPMLRGMSDEVRASLGAQVPFPSRLGTPEEFALLVRHIVENEMLNGEVIRLDGAIRMTAK